MTTNPGSDGWYLDKRTAPHSPGYVWTYGIEVWCNMEGQYLQIVADLSHLLPSYEMSLCSLGVMGASYIRDDPLTEVFEIYQGTTVSLTIPSIYNEIYRNPSE